MSSYRHVSDLVGIHTVLVEFGVETASTINRNLSRDGRVHLGEAVFTLLNIIHCLQICGSPLLQCFVDWWEDIVTIGSNQAMLWPNTKNKSSFLFKSLSVRLGPFLTVNQSVGGARRERNQIFLISWSPDPINNLVAFDECEWCWTFTFRILPKCPMSNVQFLSMDSHQQSSAQLLHDGNLRKHKFHRSH
jgi:hypothetical protein